MTHSAFGPTVSFEEAQRIERETAEHLLKSRKLSLIVDLDQTIVHATVDPTVGEWIVEGESWEQRQASAGQDSSEPGSNAEECPNPNWEALKDVKKFRLGPESFGLPSAQGRRKAKAVENEGCMYYIKPRCVAVLLFPVRILYAPDPAGKNSLKMLQPSMKCTFIPWVRAHMLNRFAPLSIPTGNSFGEDCSVGTKVAVSTIFTLSYLALTQHKA